MSQIRVDAWFIRNDDNTRFRIVTVGLTNIELESPNGESMNVTEKQLLEHFRSA